MSTRPMLFPRGQQRRSPLFNRLTQLRPNTNGMAPGSPSSLAPRNATAPGSAQGTYSLPATGCLTFPDAKVPRGLPDDRVANRGASAVAGEFRKKPSQHNFRVSRRSGLSSKLKVVKFQL